MAVGEEAEPDAGGERGDHFGKPGANERARAAADEATPKFTCDKDAPQRR